MHIKDRDNFITKWKKYFKDAELPLTFYYSDSEGLGDLVQPGIVNRCIIAALLKARKGQPMRLTPNRSAASAAKGTQALPRKSGPTSSTSYPAGYRANLRASAIRSRPNCQGDHGARRTFTAPARFIVFKRWDLLDESDQPQVVIFIAKPDVSPAFSLWPALMRPRPNESFLLSVQAARQLSHTPYHGVAHASSKTCP